MNAPAPTLRARAYESFQRQIIDANIRPGQFISQRVTQAALRQAVAIVRRGVEAAAAFGPGRLERGAGVVVAHRCEQVAQRRTAEPEARAVRAGKEGRHCGGPGLHLCRHGML